MPTITLYKDKLNGAGAGIGGPLLVGACWGAITGAVIGGVAGGLWFLFRWI